MPRRRRTFRPPAQSQSIDQAVKQLSISDSDEDVKSSVNPSDTQSTNPSSSQSINQSTKQSTNELVKQKSVKPTTQSSSQSSNETRKRSNKQVIKQATKQSKSSRNEMKIDNFEVYGALSYPERAGVKQTAAQEDEFFAEITQTLNENLKQKPLMMCDTVRVSKLIMTRGQPGDENGAVLTVYLSKAMTEMELDLACTHGQFEQNLGNRVRQCAHEYSEKHRSPSDTREDMFSVLMRSEYTVSKPNNTYQWGAEKNDVTILVRSVECLANRQADWRIMLSELNEDIAQFLPNHPIKDPTNLKARRVTLSNMDRNLCITLTFPKPFAAPTSEWCQTTISYVCVLLVYARKAQLARRPNDEASLRSIDEINTFMMAAMAQSVMDR